MFGLVQRRGQPRRGRQGVLVLPRQHPDALLPQVPLQVPAARVPLRRPGGRRTARRGKQDLEYELLDTGIFDDDRYFDVVVEYAKGAPDDLVMLVTRASTAGPTPRRCTSCRRCGSATPGRGATRWPSPPWRPATPTGATATVRASHAELGDWVLHADVTAPLLFCENETNNQRLFGTPNASPYVKDGIDRAVVGGRADAVNPERTGTKVAAHHVLELAPGAQRVDPRAAHRGGGVRRARRRPARRLVRPGPARPPQGGRRVLRDGHPRRRSATTRRW